MDWNTIIGGGFAVGSIFWAGATYSRIGRIEKDVRDLAQKLGSVAEIAVMKLQLESQNREIAMLRRKVYNEELPV